MNAGGQQTSMPVPGGLNIGVVKEPRGLIRVLQWVFAIFAFSTTAGFWTSVSFKIADQPGCDPATISFTYPFKIEDASTTCNVVKITGDLTTQAEYFVAVGVLAFLYCMGILAVYFLFEPLYQSNALVPLIDFGFTGIFTIFWLTASSAWAQGVSDLKYFGNPAEIIKSATPCAKTSTLEQQCTVLDSGSYATLNVSLIFGFANFALWAASLWFIYKETEWFKKRNEEMGNNPA